MDLSITVQYDHVHGKSMELSNSSDGKWTEKEQLGIQNTQLLIFGSDNKSGCWLDSPLTFICKFWSKLKEVFYPDTSDREVRMRYKSRISPARHPVYSPVVINSDLSSEVGTTWHIFHWPHKKTNPNMKIRVPTNHVGKTQRPFPRPSLVELI
jgi:hypothetical protein